MSTTENALGFGITAASLRAYDWQAVLDTAARHECLSYYEGFVAKVKALQPSDNDQERRVYRFLSAIASFWPNFHSAEMPFRPKVYSEGHRSAIPDDLIMADLDALREILGEIRDAEFRARAADLLWVCRRDYKAAQTAVDAYIESSKILETGDRWPPFAERLQRAMQVGAQIGRVKVYHQKAIGAVEAAFIRHETTESGLLCAQLMHFLLHNDVGDPKTYSTASEKLARRMETIPNWHFARDYWQLKAAWDLKAGKPDAARAARLQTANTHIKLAENLVTATPPPFMISGFNCTPPSGGDDLPTVEALPRAGTSFQPAAVSIVEANCGRVIADYELLQEIAKGGMGVVYRARQISLNRTVALKMMLSGEHAGAEEIARFRTEAEAAANLGHPNIVQIYETGEADGRHFFSMQLIEGGNLSQQTARFKAAPVEAAKVIAKVARAVHFAHQHGILHRDLKPANILLDKDGEPHITDFGLARRTSASSDLTLSGAILGTPNYMAPEQAQGKTRELTTAADVYSLGTILYQLITGKVPFQAATPLETLRLVLEEDPPRPSTVNLKIDRDLETICLKCLEKNPSQRYGSAESLALDLERWLRHEPIVARPGTAWANTIKWVKRRPSAAIVIATIVVSTAVLLVTLGQSRIVLREQRDDALAEKLRAEHLLNEMQLGKAEDQFATGDAAAALANLAQVLRRDPSNELAAARMVSALDYRSFALRTTKAAVTNAVFAPVPNLTNSPDHTKRLVLAYTNFVRVIEAATGRTLFTLPHKEMVLSTTFSPDGLLIATASQDGTAHLWDAGTGVPIGPALTHDHYVIFANFSPDSRWLATGSQDGTAKIWRTDDGAEMGAPMLHQGFLSSAQFDDGAERLLTTARDGTIRLWNARTGEPLIEPIYQTAVKATLSADGMAIKALVSQKPEQTFYWTVPGPRLLPRKFPQQSKIMSIHFSRDGEKFVTGCVDGNARIWSLRAGALAAPLLHHAGTVWYACFSPDGTRVLTTSTDHTAQVWNVLTGEPIGAPMSHGDWVLFGGFSPDGKKVATGAGDNTARIWDVQTGLPLTEPLTNSGPVRSVFFNHKGDWLATAGRKGELAVWEVATGKLLQHYNLPGAINCARFSPDDRTILTAAFNGEAQLWDVKTGRAALSPFKHNSVVNSAQFSPDGNLAVTASSDHTAKVWDAHTGKMLSKVFHKGEIEYVEFFPDSRRFITVSRDKTARVWDARTGQALSESFVHDAGYRKLLSGFSQIGMADLSDNGQSLATIGDDGTAWIWAISSPPAPVPSWLPDLAEALGGKKLADSAIETVSSENLLEVQDKLGLEQTGFYKDWAQVFGK